MCGKASTFFRSFRLFRRYTSLKVHIEPHVNSSILHAGCLPEKCGCFSGHAPRVNFKPRSRMDSYTYSNQAGDEFAEAIIQDFEEQQQQRGASSSQQFMVSITLNSYCLLSHRAWLTDDCVQQSNRVLPKFQRLADQPFSGDCRSLFPWTFVCPSQLVSIVCNTQPVALCQPVS